MHRLRQDSNKTGRDRGSSSHVVTGHHDNELVTAHTTCKRTGIETAQQTVGDDADEAITTAVTKRVVDSLKAVKVAEQQANWSRLISAGKQLIQHFQRAASVVQAGQWIVSRLMGEPLINRCQLIVDTGQLTSFVSEVAQQSLTAPLQSDRVERVATDSVVQQ